MYNREVITCVYGKNSVICKVVAGRDDTSCMEQICAQGIQHVPLLVLQRNGSEKANTAQLNMNSTCYSNILSQTGIVLQYISEDANGT